MKIANKRFEALSIAAVIALSVSLNGVVNTLPGFIGSFKDNIATSNYSNIKMSIDYTDKDAAFYKKTADHISPLYPDFKFTAEPNGLALSSDNIDNEKNIGLIIFEIKSIEPSVFWSVSQGCIGRDCPQSIKLTLKAKQLDIETKGN